jgi:hypothetical protein
MGLLPDYIIENGLLVYAREKSPAGAGLLMTARRGEISFGRRSTLC